MLPIAINNTQDTSLQNFASIYLGKNHLGMELGDELDPNVVSYAAAVSIILGSKLHESNGELTLVSSYNYYFHSFYCTLLFTTF